MRTPWAGPRPELGVKLQHFAHIRGARSWGGPWWAPAVKMASAVEGDVGKVVEPIWGLRSGFEELSLNKLATSLGASEQALRLIISIFLGKDPPASLRPLAESPGNSGGMGTGPPSFPEATQEGSVGCGCES